MIESKGPTAKATPKKAAKKPGRGNGEGSKATQFKPGNTIGVSGKPKGLRNHISRDFLEDVITVWNETNERGDKTGLDALRTLASTRPAQFVAAVGNLVPREFSLDDEGLTLAPFAALLREINGSTVNLDTSSPAAEEVSIFSSRERRETPRFLSVSTTSRSSRRERPSRSSRTTASVSPGRMNLNSSSSPGRSKVLPDITSSKMRSARGGLQALPLPPKVLIAGRDTGIAENVGGG
jgi:hypothetical protein